MGINSESSEAKGLKSLAKDFYEDLRIKAHVDAQATRGQPSGGIGEARHIETAEHWTQGALERHELELRNVVGESNPPGALTKPVGGTS